MGGVGGRVGSGGGGVGGANMACCMGVVPSQMCLDAAHPPLPVPTFHEPWPAGGWAASPSACPPAHACTPWSSGMRSPGTWHLHGRIKAVAGCLLACMLACMMGAWDVGLRLMLWPCCDSVAAWAPCMHARLQCPVGPTPACMPSFRLHPGCTGMTIVPALPRLFLWNVM